MVFRILQTRGKACQNLKFIAFSNPNNDDLMQHGFTGQVSKQLVDNDFKMIVYIRHDCSYSLVHLMSHTEFKCSWYLQAHTSLKRINISAPSVCTICKGTDIANVIFFS